MLEFLIYLIVLCFGLILGLRYSYKLHAEPYIIKSLNVNLLIIAIVGWILIFNFMCCPVLESLGLFLAGFTLGQRPGYGRKESLIAFIIGILTALINYIIGVI